MQTQEILSLAIPVVWLAAFATQEQRARVSDPVNAALMAMFLVHYIHRDLIYPFRIVPGGCGPGSSRVHGVPLARPAKVAAGIDHPPAAMMMRMSACRHTPTPGPHLQAKAPHWLSGPWPQASVRTTATFRC